MNVYTWGGLVAAAPLSLLLAGMIPSRTANRHVGTVARLVTCLTLVAFLLAIVNAALLAFRSPLNVALVSAPTPLAVEFGIYFDSLAAVMLLLVSFVGFIITRYSYRYLAGEQTQGRFFRWISFTLGAVLLMVVANNLVLFTAAWMLTSFGLHQLLTHYDHRPAAVMAARKKFLISRIGDTLLLCALVLTYRIFGSFDYATLFNPGEELTAQYPGTLTAIGLLYVIGAMTKSAQFPFHSWLPDTMETPTPVSALMHAGVINAGGFLVIRLSPLIATSHFALDLLAGVGAITALFGVVVMITQTSIKRSLAYSTIAQMGFMMLQCGLGAFSAALLHIVAHSLYKAYAFLTSGTLVPAEATKEACIEGQTTLRLGTIFILAGSIAAAISSGASLLFGTTSPLKPGGLVLGIVLTTALTHLLWKSFSTMSLKTSFEGVIKAFAVTLIYYSAYQLMDMAVASALPQTVAALSSYDLLLIVAVLAGFVFVFVLQEGLVAFRSLPWMRQLYVHASQGFYVDIVAQKWTRFTWDRILRL